MLQKFGYKVLEIFCQPKNHGGLGLRSLLTLNNASNIKFSWDIQTIIESWALILRARVLRNQSTIDYHIFSSIWTGVKPEFPSLSSNMDWHLGHGKNIHLKLSKLLFLNDLSNFINHSI